MTEASTNVATERRALRAPRAALHETRKHEKARPAEEQAGRDVDEIVLLRENAACRDQDHEERGQRGSAVRVSRGVQRGQRGDAHVHAGETVAARVVALDEREK